MTTRLERRVNSWGEIAPTRPPTSNPFRPLVDRECQLRPPTAYVALPGFCFFGCSQCSGLLTHFSSLVVMG